MPWLSGTEYSRLLATLDAAEQRAFNAEAALAAERAANRESERHFADMILRKAGSFPQPKPQPPSTGEPEPAFTSEVPGMDQGEIEAVVAAGLEMGLTRADALSTLRRARHLE